MAFVCPIASNILFSQIGGRPAKQRTVAPSWSSSQKTFQPSQRCTAGPNNSLNSFSVMCRLYHLGAQTCSPQTIVQSLQEPSFDQGLHTPQLCQYSLCTSRVCPHIKNILMSSPPFSQEGKPKAVRLIFTPSLVVTNQSPRGSSAQTQHPKPHATAHGGHRRG